MKHRMSRLQRAKQFMPFAALRGFEALLTAVARPKEDRAELSEDQIDELNTAKSKSYYKPKIDFYSNIIQIDKEYGHTL